MIGIRGPAAHQWAASLCKISDLSHAAELWLAAHLGCAKGGCQRVHDRAKCAF